MIVITLAGIKCSNPLTAPHKGSVEYNSTIVGSEARYSCLPGYQLLLGDSIRTCLPGGEWSGVAPCCTRKCLEGLFTDLEGCG